MGDIGKELMGLYRETQRHGLSIFNYLIMISSVLVGSMELFKIVSNADVVFRSPLFIQWEMGDVAMSILLIVVGISTPLFFHKNKFRLYRISLFILFIIWLYLLFFFIFIFVIGHGNFTWILIVNILIQILYSMKISE